VSAKVERLRAQHTDVVREKSTADSKCRKLAEKVAALEGERTDLRRQLVEERREANQAIAKAQAEAKLARVEGSLASQRAEEWEVLFNALQARMERAEASTRSEVERTRKQLVDLYRELGARTADFEVPD
jgi:chromosome segregation ATPase